jgi:putative solute:sodium symporter small subunit
MSHVPDRAHRLRYRQTHTRLSVVLMLIWFVVSFVIPFYAREWAFPFMNWPFSFWMAAQGSILIYIMIVVVYAYRMNRLDDQYQTTDDSQV